MAVLLMREGGGGKALMAGPFKQDFFVRTPNNVTQNKDESSIGAVNKIK